jgi:hypothetical protein
MSIDFGGLGVGGGRRRDQQHTTGQGTMVMDPWP